MDLEITGTTDRWLKLKKDGIGVDFLGIPILIANISFSKIKIFCSLAHISLKTTCGIWNQNGGTSIEGSK